MRHASLKTAGTALALIISALLLFVAGRSLGRLQERSRESGRVIALEAVERSVMQCYALEGAYPPDLRYLVDNYGLIIEEDRFVYLYEVVAGNIHPIVGVQFPGENG